MRREWLSRSNCLYEHSFQCFGRKRTSHHSSSVFFMGEGEGVLFEQVALLLWIHVWFSERISLPTERRIRKGGKQILELWGFINFLQIGEWYLNIPFKPAPRSSRPKNSFHIYFQYFMRGDDKKEFLGLRKWNLIERQRGAIWHFPAGKGQKLQDGQIVFL